MVQYSMEYFKMIKYKNYYLKIINWMVKYNKNYLKIKIY